MSLPEQRHPTWRWWWRRKELLMALLLLLLVSNIQTTNHVPDICSPSQVGYCNCDDIGRNEARLVHCLFYTHVDSRHGIWTGFQDQLNIEMLSLTSTLATPLNFVPTDTLKLLPRLRHFSIKDANISVIKPFSFGTSQQLTRLDLERNAIARLSQNAFANLTSLSKLALSENVIRKLSAEVFVNLTNLDELFLDRNRIRQIEDNAFVHLNLLRSLDLWDNDLRDITKKTFAGLQNLRRLDLFRNKITRLGDGIFKEMTLLKELDLKENAIEFVSSRAFEGLENLVSVTMLNNRLKVLPPRVFRGLKVLMYVDVSSNELVQISKDVITDIEKFGERSFVFNFKGNRIRCDCHILWMQDEGLTVEDSYLHRQINATTCIAMRDQPSANMTAGNRYPVLSVRPEFLDECIVIDEDVASSTHQPPSSDDDDDNLDEKKAKEGKTKISDDNFDNSPFDDGHQNEQMPEKSDETHQHHHQNHRLHQSDLDGGQSKEEPKDSMTEDKLTSTQKPKELSHSGHQSGGSNSHQKSTNFGIIFVTIIVILANLRLNELFFF